MPLHLLAMPVQLCASLCPAVPSLRSASLCCSMPPRCHSVLSPYVAALCQCGSLHRHAFSPPCVTVPELRKTKPLLGCSALSRAVATQYHRASRPRHARALPRIATLCQGGSLLCISLAEPLPASQCLSTAGQRLAKQCLSFSLPIPRLALQNCTVPSPLTAQPCYAEA